MRKSIGAWMKLGNDIIEYMCSQINCGKEPSLEQCQHCKLYTMSNNIAYQYEMGWYYVLQQTLLSWKSSYEQTIQEMKDYWSGALSTTRTSKLDIKK